MIFFSRLWFIEFNPHRAAPHCGVLYKFFVRISDFDRKTVEEMLISVETSPVEVETHN
jgi:hypothetical protein